MIMMTKINMPVQDKPNFSFFPRTEFSQARNLNSQRISLSMEKPLIQPKLVIGEDDDPYEREADRVADTVMRMTEPTNVSQYNRLNHLRCQTTNAATVEEAPSSVHEVLNSLGQSLDEGTRAYMEPRFGYDFSKVRIHTDTKAAESARTINALAYTVGNDMVFGSGQYNPVSIGGQKIIGHELTHVVQQNQGRQVDYIQRIDWGPLGGKGCNESPEGNEWALVGEGTWQALAKGECTGFFTDCDGMTCGGGFYYITNLEGGVCKTPRKDDATFRERRWTPNKQASEARSPRSRGSGQGNTPPGYVYDNE